MGYFLGDGPGVGKGRQIGGMIAENHFRGDSNRTKALWLSLSADLIWDAKRDFRDLGLHKEIPCFDLKVRPCFACSDVLTNHFLLLRPWDLPVIYED